MPEPLKSPLTPEYRYNPTARRYIGASGRFVSQSAVRGALDSTLAASRTEIRRVSLQLARGEITTAQWQTSMAQQIKNAHLASGSAARGGWAQMTQGDYGAVGNRLRRQYEYLNNFANDIASGKQKLNGNFLRRADMYGDAARGTHEDMRRRVMADGGYSEERRLRAAKDSCPDCIEYEARGWQPIGTLPRIGDSACRTNCKCSFEYRNAAGEISR